MYSSWRNMLFLLWALLAPLSHVAAEGSGSKDDMEPKSSLPWSLGNLLYALDDMQSTYFELLGGTWPTAIDWTAAVMGTYVSATLTTIASTIDYSFAACHDVLEWDNMINRYFSQLTAFYFGENSFGLRNQAYDDMLWVVLGWLENVKFSSQYTKAYWQAKDETQLQLWHGSQLAGPAAHRARIFYDIATQGWDTELCGGGMTWNPSLEPYKNAITNELFISASVAMYIYFPGDDNNSPFLANRDSRNAGHPPHSHQYLSAAVKAYDWLKTSNLRSHTAGLYMDGFHITNWTSRSHPGTRHCDKLDSMVYTYNQGVLLSGLKGLWISTNKARYLADAHTLVDNVITATGWHRRGSNQTRSWAGLGRDGVMEEFCDSRGDCSQDGQTFKGIFFHHLAELCRPLWDSEKDFMYSRYGKGLNEMVLGEHQSKCAGYAEWVKWNAEAAVATKDGNGRYGMWWGRSYNPAGSDADQEKRDAALQVPDLPNGAVDYRNHPESPWSNSSTPLNEAAPTIRDTKPRTSDLNDRGRGRTVETQSGGVAVLRAQWMWERLIGSNAQTQSGSDFHVSAQDMFDMSEVEEEGQKHVSVEL